MYVCEFQKIAICSLNVYSQVKRLTNKKYTRTHTHRERNKYTPYRQKIDQFGGGVVGATLATTLVIKSSQKVSVNGTQLM